MYKEHFQKIAKLAYELKMKIKPGVDHASIEKNIKEQGLNCERDKKGKLTHVYLPLKSITINND